MSNPVRILRVVGRLDIGGLETIIMNMYRIIDRDKLQFDFVMHTQDECAYCEEIRSLGGKIYSVPQYTGRNHFKYIKAWNDFFKEHKEYRLVHGHVRSTASIYLPIAKKFGLTTIAHSHSTSSGQGLSSFVKDILQMPIRFEADYLLACSLPAGKWLFGNNVVKKQNFKVIPNGIDVNKYIFNISIREEVRKEFDIHNQIVIGHVGRFHKAKNHSFLLSTFKKINSINPNTVLMLVGDGELRKQITEQISALSLNNKVILTGSRRDVPRLLQAMDVFVFPSFFEGFGNAVIEAQAAGLPCIVSDNIPCEVKVTDLVEFLPLNNNVEYWALKIMRKINDSKRENTSEYISSAGYDVRPIAKWYQEFYLENSLR